MAGTTVDDKWTIDKLDSSNWTTWKFQMRHLLLAKGLWGFVDGSETLAEEATAQARAEFKSKSQKAFSIIVMSVSTSQLYLITSVEKPEDAWDALRNHFDRDTLANKLMLKKQYFRMTMKEGTSVEAHLKSMKELTDKLAAIGAPIDEEDQVVTLLGSLPRNYSTLVTALEARTDALTLSYTQQALIHEEKKQNVSEESHGTTSGGPAALIGEQGTTKSCWECGGLGHFRRNCPRRKPKHKAKPVAEKESDSDSDSSGAFAASLIKQPSDSTAKWLVDSGASSHMTSKKEWLVNYREFEKPESVCLGDGRTVEASGVGEVHLKMLFKISDPKKCVMHQVLYVPKLACNLFSVRAASSKGNIVKFGATKCWIRSRSGSLQGIGALVGKLYQLHCEPVTQECASVASSTDENADLWHQRLGHVSEQRLSKMMSKELVTGMNVPRNSELSFCEGCIEGKLKRKPFKPVREIRSKRKLQCIHSDVCGPMPTESIGKRRYFVTFIDDYTRCCRVYFMRNKSEVFTKFKEFEAITTNDCGERICTLRTDNGGEYVSSEFENYLKQKGIHHELTVPHSPQQNGVAERLNQTLMDSARSMLAHAGLPDCYWAEAVATAAYLRNRTPTTAFKESSTPYERWYGKKPNLKHLKVFGCTAYAHIPDSQRQKLDKKAEKLRFVGYSIKSKGYRLLDEKTNNIVVRRDVVFNETDFLHKTESKHNKVVEVDVQPEQDDKSQESEIQDQSKKYPQRKREPPVRFGRDEYATPAIQVTEPATMKEALQSDLAAEWKAAIDSEYQSLRKNDTWNLVELPSNKKTIGCKWVFKIKRSKDGEVERFKARLVAKGYSQKYGVDYDQTFAPVVRFSSIRTLLAFAVEKDMLIHQMDVETAFLNGVLEEEIYMHQPEGYTQPGSEHLVCKLKKSLYGLKQSPRCWSTAFRQYVGSIQFQQSTADPCVFIREEGDDVTIVAIYVDDLIIITKTIEKMNEVKRSLAAQFKMKDFGKIHYCLGITIIHDQEEECLWLHQRQYILAMLEKYGLSEAKSISTPADVSVMLTKNDGVSNSVDPSLYQSMVGSVLYAAIATRPDIAQAVGAVSKFNSAPNATHLTAVKRILRYLKGTVDLALKYEKSSDETLTGFSDADWAGDPDNRHSTSGNLFLMARGAISWCSKKQCVVALSTSEAEYVALCFATQEAVWLKRLLSDVGVNSRKPITIFEDNQGTIAIARNPVSHARTKHIDIKYHFVREAVQDGTIDLIYCPTEDMIADLMTKPVTRSRFEFLRQAMGMTILKTV